MGVLTNREVKEGGNRGEGGGGGGVGGEGWWEGKGSLVFTPLALGIRSVAEDKYR